VKCRFQTGTQGALVVQQKAGRGKRLGARKNRRTGEQRLGRSEREQAPGKLPKTGEDNADKVSQTDLNVKPGEGKIDWSH